MKTVTRVAFVIACLAVSNLARAAGQTSANFAIPRDSINTGVAVMSSTSFILASSIGDSVATGPITSPCFQLTGGFRAQIDTLPSIPKLLSVVSRKTHGTMPFELTIDPIHALPCQVTVEPRSIGSGHTLVFRFDSPVFSVGGATARDQMMNVLETPIPGASGSEVVVRLTNIPDAKRLTLTLTGLNGSGTTAVSLGFLVGDVTNSRTVSSADISAVKANQGSPLNMSTFRYDLNTSGAISSMDVSVVKARSGRVLP